MPSWDPRVRLAEQGHVDQEREEVYGFYEDGVGGPMGTAAEGLPESPPWP